MKALLLVVALSHAQFGAKFIGEGGGSNPTPESNNALETAAGGPAASNMAIIERVAPPKHKDPEEKDLSDEPKSPISSRQFDGAPPRPELQDPAAKLFGDEPAPQKQPEAELPAPVAASGPQPGEVFVALDVDLAGRPDRDAVADLSRVAAFRPDGRFPPQARGKDQVLLWGWMPPSKIADSFQVRGVSRVQMDPPARRASFEGARGPVSVALRLAPGQDARSLTAELERDVPGFKLTGETRVEDGLALVEAELPLRELPRLMARGDVVKTGPAQPKPILASAVAQPEGGFLKFAAGRAPILLICTLLLLLPPVTRALSRAGQIFIPYQK